jgi:hypothetical protein
MKFNKSVRKRCKRVVPAALAAPTGVTVVVNGDDVEE